MAEGQLENGVIGGEPAGTPVSVEIGFEADDGGAGFFPGCHWVSM